MKKYLLIFIVFILLAGNIYAQQLNLDTIIERSARAVEEVLPQGAKVAVLNFVSTSETFSDHVIEELTGKLVNGRKITIVDRRNLALISQEMNLQLSGDVSDESAQAIGRMLGAQSIVSGTLTNMGTFYRFRVRVINVETAAIQSQISLDLRNDEQVAFLLGGGATSGPPVVAGGTTSTIEGIIVPGNNLTEKLAWLQRSADSHNTYILDVRSNENIAPHTFEYTGAINITIVLRGFDTNRIIRLRSHGNMFTVRSNVTLILDNNITLQGHNGNTGNIVQIEGGKLIMNTGATITGGHSGVILPSRNGTFEMNGGVISGIFGGHPIWTAGTFIMNGGTISGNTSLGGGGVWIDRGGTFTMVGGSITGNRAPNGGGVGVLHGTFTMRGGTISGNIAYEYGGGVFVASNGVFTKTGGIITGYGNDQNNGNVVKDEAGHIMARRGHAAFVNTTRRKETTAGLGVNLNNNTATGWDN